MNAIGTTTRTISAAPSAGVLTRLAERWRPTGLFLACFGPDGTLVWHDPQMPRLLSLAINTSPLLEPYVRGLIEDGSVAGAAPDLLPGLGVQWLPISRRRRVHGYLAVLARTGNLQPTEELHRAAGQHALDVPSLVAAAQRLPLVSAAHLTSLASLIGQMHDDLQTAGMSQQELSSITEQLSGVYEEISLLYKISSGMRFSQKPNAFLESVCREVQELGHFRTMAVAFARRDDETAAPVVGEMAILVGECPLQGQDLINALHAPIHQALSQGEPQVHNDLTAYADASRLSGAIERFVCVPLIRDRRPLGVLLAIDKIDQNEFTSVDLKLLTNVGSQCSIFLENASLYQDMQDLFMGVMHALTRSIDAKDAYTRGHSQRVAEVSRMLARKIGLPDEQCERVYLSGLLHDVGKIGVPEAVLTKPGRLSDSEFEAIRKHPAIGAQILGSIRNLQDIIPGVLYHHERWDGRGYPYNLAADNIPLMGRIISVADAFDAMSSTRTYRPALPLETVLGEITRCAGSQFDPTLAKVFIDLDFAEYRRKLSAQQQLSGGVREVTL